MTKKRSKSKIPRSMRKRFQEQKRARRAINEGYDRLIQRAKQRSMDSEAKLPIAESETEKMSEIIIDFAQPLMDAATSAAEQKKAISVAIIGWNLSLLPKELQPKQMSEIKKVLDSPKNSTQFSNEGLEIFNYLMARKKALFPGINRMVVDYELVETPKGFHLQVVSSIVETEANP
jgi:hypothetical protein